MSDPKSLNLFKFIENMRDGSYTKVMSRLDFLDRPIENIYAPTFVKIGDPVLVERIGYYVDATDEKKASKFEIGTWTAQDEAFINNIATDGTTAP